MVTPKQLYDAFIALGYEEDPKLTTSLSWLVFHNSQSDPFSIPRRGSVVNKKTLDEARQYEPQLNV